MKGLTVILGAALAVAGCASLPPDRADLVATPEVCAPQRFDVYFRDGEAGLTDARGGAVANLDLSERRALAVTEALEAAGWPAPVFSLMVAGESGSVTADGASEPMRRRTEVLVDAAPR